MKERTLSMVIILDSEQVIFGDVSCQLVDMACTEGCCLSNISTRIRSIHVWPRCGASNHYLFGEGRGVDLMQPAAVVFLRVIDAVWGHTLMTSDRFGQILTKGREVAMKLVPRREGGGGTKSRKLS